MEEKLEKRVTYQLALTSKTIDGRLDTLYMQEEGVVPCDWVKKVIHEELHEFLEEVFGK